MTKKKGRKPNSKILKDLNSKNSSLEHCYIAHLPITIDDINKFNNKFDKKENNNIKLNNNIKFSNNILELSSPKKNIENKKNTKIINTKNSEQINKFYNYSSVKFNNNKKGKLCWWCCHCFDNDPIYLPESINDDVYNVYGYFCSFNCALAYNFDLRDNNVWKRTNYLNKLYYDIYNKYTKICCAPSKYILNSFGGSITIEEFRKNFLVNNNYRLIIPPFEGLIPSIEINQISNINNNSNNNLIKITNKKKIIQDDKNNMKNIMNLRFT